MTSDSFLFNSLELDSKVIQLVSFLVGRNEYKSFRFKHHWVEKYENFSTFSSVRSSRNADPIDLKLIL